MLSSEQSGEQSEQKYCEKNSPGLGQCGQLGGQCRKDKNWGKGSGSRERARSLETHYWPGLGAGSLLAHLVDSPKCDEQPRESLIVTSHIGSILKRCLNAASRSGVFPGPGTVREPKFHYAIGGLGLALVEDSKQNTGVKTWCFAMRKFLGECPLHRENYGLRKSEPKFSYLDSGPVLMDLCANGFCAMDYISGTSSGSVLIKLY